jgi:diguanylate cyclase (GGDEF)-like protein
MPKIAATQTINLRISRSTDPWDFIVWMNGILSGENSHTDLMQTVRTALLEIPDLAGAWIGKIEYEGRPVRAVDIAVCPEHHRDLVNNAWRTGKPQMASLAAALPLRGRTVCHGLLVLQANRPGFLGSTWSAQTLSHLASLIGNALDSFGERAVLERTRILYQTLFSGVDRLLATRSEGQALRLLCKTLVDSGLFVSAGVGIVGAGGVHRHIAAAARRNVRALRTASLVYAKGQQRRPLTFDAWETSKTVVANTYLSNPRFEPTYELAETLGFRSIAALIIHRGGAPWGIISVSAAEENFFDRDLIELLERLTGMVGRVLDELDLKATLRAERETQRRIAREDMLTALPNRRAFHEVLTARLKQAAQTGAGLTVAMLDLNGFKQINDQWGHAAGDHVLRTVGGRIRAVLREADFAGRLGGDEFALIMDGFPGPRHSADDEAHEGTAGFCERLQRVVSAPLMLPNGRTAHVTLCAGFAASSPDTPDADALLRRADRALYEAKAESGRDGRFWRVYRDRDAGRDWPLDIWSLLQNGALVAHFQPVLDLEDGRIIAIEALARLRDAGGGGGDGNGGGLIPPAKFLPHMTVDERFLLFCKILEAGMDQLARLDADGHEMCVSVNLDGEVLLREKMLPYIKKTLTRRRMAPARLVLEILETHEFFSLTQANSQIKALQAMGVRIALDDVGAGHSSLLKVRDLPLDILKLDRNFVSRLREQPDDLVFIATLQTLTAALRMLLVVEGAEDEVVIGALRIVGVRHVQGYAIARPMDGPALMNWLRDYRPRQVPAAPTSLLGAYALHWRWLRAMEFCQGHEATLTSLLRSDLLRLSEFFAGPGAVHEAVREAYEKLRLLMQEEVIDLPAILSASLVFRHRMIEALAQRPGQPGKLAGTHAGRRRKTDPAASAPAVALRDSARRRVRG